MRETAAYRAAHLGRDRRPSLIAAVAGGLRDAVARPGAVLALLAIQLVAAIALAAPLATLLSSELDHNLYGETMARGASWRWFDTVDRQQPAVLGDLGAWNALFDDEGVHLGDLARLSGVPLGIALAGLAFYWLNALLHTGWLWALGGGGDGGGPSLGPAPARGAAAATFAGAIRFALPATLIALLAAVFYAAAYALLYVGLGALLEDAGEASRREWVSLGLTWMRLALVLAAFLGVKLWSDLAKAALVARATAGASGLAALPGALLTATGQLLRRGPVYATAYLAIGLGTPLLAALWWVVTLPLEPATLWPILIVMVLAQQLFAGARIALRLAHLAATRRLLVE